MIALDPVEALLGLPRFGSGLGLHRVLALLEALDSRWLGSLDALKITGSNGKGSTCAMAAAILRALGLRVGVWTSPHLWRVHERIVVEGQPIDDGDLRSSAAWVHEQIEAWCGQAPDGCNDQFGAFEALTAVAMHHFARAGVDTVVAEAGIGGRYDPTRVIPGQICGLVSVAREHTALLGETEEAIAFDKADLCPSGGQLITGPLPAPLWTRLHAYARLRNVQLHRARADTECTVEHAGPAGSTWSLQCEGQSFTDLQLALAGDHMIDNAIVAIRLVQRWVMRHRPERWPSIPAATRAALGSLRLRGRLQQVHDDPPVLVDIGHNRAALERVAATLARDWSSAPLLLVIGVSADRDPELIAPVLPLAAQILCTRAEHRGGAPDRVEAVVQRLAPQIPRLRSESLQEALDAALPLARAQGTTVVVVGSLFLAMEAVCALQGEDPRLLRFL